jgi:hypothetical protein
LVGAERCVPSGKRSTGSFSASPIEWMSSRVEGSRSTSIHWYGIWLLDRNSLTARLRGEERAPATRIPSYGSRTCAVQSERRSSRIG